MLISHGVFHVSSANVLGGGPFHGQADPEPDHQADPEQVRQADPEPVRQADREADPLKILKLLG